MKPSFWHSIQALFDLDPQTWLQAVAEDPKGRAMFQFLGITGVATIF